MHNSLPNKINKYTYVTSETNGQSDTTKAIYSEINSDKKVFIKIGSRRSEISKEFNNQKYFYSILKDLPNSYITIPNPISIEKTKGGYALIMDYIENSRSLNDFNTNQKTAAYIIVLNTLNTLNVSNTLPKVTATYQLLSLIYFYIANIVTYPKRWFLITKSVLKILKYIPAWLSLKHTTLCHGDFNVTNILITQDKLALLDFSKACISHKYLNPAQALNSSWKDKGFQELLSNRIILDFKLSSKEIKILKSFVLFNLMQRLCKQYETIEQEEFYFNKMKEVSKSI